MKTGRTVRRLVLYLKPYPLLLLGAFLGALSSVPLGLLVPVLVGKAIDLVLGKGRVDFPGIARLLLLAALCAAAAALLQWLFLLCTRRLSVLAAQEMRKQAFRSIHDAPLQRLDENRRGDLVSRLVNDADLVAEGVSQALSQLFPGLVTIAATIVLMLLLSVPIALVVMVATPLSVLFARFITRRTYQMFREQSAAQGAISARVNEMVAGQAVVAAFGQEEAVAAGFALLNDRYTDAHFKATFYSSLSNPGTRFLNALVYAAVGALGALAAITGGITVGGLSAFLAYANQYTRPFNEVSAVLAQMQGAVAGAERLFEVMDWQPEPPDPPGAQSPAHSRGLVQARDVAFSYHPQKPLLQDISFTALSGQRIALVGPTGCGKTTLINLLMRFYEIQAGEITLDGVPTGQIRRDALRSLHGMVLQDTWLKEATVFENIAYGRPGATLRQVEAAAREAKAHSFIRRLPDGYGTVLQPGGGNLSAGQRQLLCIARIMLSKPDILILDEATSSIDSRTEMLIQRALEKLMQGHTTFVVAHRLSTVQSADQILVMQDGRIVERGPHAALLLQNGVYARLYRSQFDTGENSS